MKKNYLLKKGICIVLSIAMLGAAACGTKTGEAANTNSRTTESTTERTDNGTEEKETGTQTASAADEAIEMIKAKYEAAAANYSGNIIEVKRDESIQIKLGFNPWDSETSIQEDIVVYQDAEMTQPLDLFGYDYDAETGMLTIAPPTFGVAEMTDSDNVNISDLSGDYIYDSENTEEGGWGNLSQYYMVTKVDLETGKPLAKPEITVIKVKAEISQAPQMKFTQTENGEARFYWQPVEGATEYLVFCINDFGEDMGLDSYAQVVARTTGTEWVCENYMFDTVAGVTEEGEVAGVMNQMFEHYYQDEDSYGTTDFNDYDEYFQYYYGVIAVNANGASVVSNLMNERDLSHMLPNTLAYDSNAGLSQVDTISELPATLGVTMCDGTTSQKILDYDFDTLEIDESNGWCTVMGKLEGTMFVEPFTIYQANLETLEEDMAAIEKRQEKLKNKGGNVEPSIDLEEKKDKPETETPVETESEEESETPVETESKKETEAPAETESEEESEAPVETESEEESEAPAETESEEESEVPAETESEQETPAPEGDSAGIDLETNVTANSALSEYIARNMLVTNTVINVSAFPEAADMNIVQDALFEAMYQNPLVLGVRGASIDKENKILYVEYDYDAETTAEKQQAVIEKVNEVVAEIITDDMTDWEKGYAINQYLCENVEYDFAALENAETNDFYYVDEEFYDSFTAYGCLVNGVGVCASYSADYKLLADAAGLESIVVTGYLEGQTPHAWNKVKIDGSWAIVDSTNNDNELINNALLNLSDSAASATLVEDGRYALDENVFVYAAETDANEYYRVTNNFFAQEEISGELAADLEESGRAMLRTDYDINDEEFNAIAQNAASTAQKDIKGLYWMGVIYLQEQ